MSIVVILGIYINIFKSEFETETVDKIKDRLLAAAVLIIVLRLVFALL